MRKLGVTQEGVLRALREHGFWRAGAGCGWYWTTPMKTAQILDTLVKRGLVTKEPCGKSYLGDQYYEYKPNAQEEGLARR